MAVTCPCKRDRGSASTCRGRRSSSIGSAREAPLMSAAHRAQRRDAGMRIDRARSRRALLCGVIALACLVTTVFPPSLAAAPAAARTLVFPNSQEPSTLDPHVATDTQSNVIILGIYESLVRFKPDTTEIEPNLATSWTASQNGLNWTFRLRPNVRFHDGSAMNAEAVVFSFNRLKTVGKGMAFVLDNVAEVRAVDAMTVAVRLSKYDVTFFQGLPSVMIVSPAAFGPQMGTDQAQRWAFSNASGTGPFRLATWTRGSRIEITKFDEYWRGWSQPHVDRILMVTVPEPGTRRLMFERGDADMLVKAEDQVDDLKVLQKRPEFTVKSFPTMSSIYLVMAGHRPPLNDVRVRRAISYAFSYKAMIEVAFGGLAAQPRGPLNPSIPFFAPDTFQYQRDIVRARRLLQEAGYG
ncbi:MAG: ABC transporter substrate-binding protein, partial [Alphaproteobacteria bacterium]|nr:ABC transporter substrate-binding protein [Alphaproteobacteria bacterium]